MSNFINPSILAAESLDQLDYELVAGALVFRDKSSDFAAQGGYESGRHSNNKNSKRFHNQ